MNKIKILKGILREKSEKEEENKRVGHPARRDYHKHSSALALPRRALRHTSRHYKYSHKCIGIHATKINKKKKSTNK